MIIRSEQAEELSAIHQLTADAFAPKSFSDGTEPDIIDALREAGDLTLSLVAIKEQVLVGHVAFSPVSIDSATKAWHGLGPVSVLPEMQRQGIGTALINEGLRLLRDRSSDGCALIGDPNYYSRFGFVSDGNLHYEGVPDEHVQWLSFNDVSPTGQLVFSPTFGD